jgi:hypothetical protein
MSKKESKMMDIYQQLRCYEDVYNTLNEYDPEARFQTNFRIYVQLRNHPTDLDGAEVTDKFVVETLIKYYADKINKLKQELKKELDKEL